MPKISLPVRVVRKVLRCFEQRRLARLVDEGSGGIEPCQPPRFPFDVFKEPGARLVLNGRLRLVSFLGGNEASAIVIHKGGTLRIDGDFTIGNGVRIFVAKGASLRIGGRRLESNSGITCNSTIMVQRSMQIGHDFLCAWNVLVTDSNWHGIRGQTTQRDVVIGDRVWVAHGVSVLKGARLGDGVVVASHSLVGEADFPPHSLIGGTPAKVLRSDIAWHKDV